MAGDLLTQTARMASCAAECQYLSTYVAFIFDGFYLDAQPDDVDHGWLVQAKLVEEVSAMLKGFAARKTAEVAAAVGGMQATLAEGRTDVTAKLGILTQATHSANSALQVGLDSPYAGAFVLFSLKLAQLQLPLVIVVCSL